MHYLQARPLGMGLRYQDFRALVLRLLCWNITRENTMTRFEEIKDYAQKVSLHVEHPTSSKFLTEDIPWLVEMVERMKKVIQYSANMSSGCLNGIFEGCL